MSHSTLQDYYQTLQALEFHHKYQTDMIESWIVFERDLKLDMIIDYLEYQKQLDKGE